jgi:outer membrane protein OmpA-like peptidoglycan-associated protein
MRQHLQWVLAVGLVLAAVGGHALAAGEATPSPPARLQSPPTEAPEGEFGQAAIGGAGLGRVRSAFVAPRSLAFSMRGGFFRVPQLTQEAGTDEYRMAEVSVAFSPLAWLEIAARLHSGTLEQVASPQGKYFLQNDFGLRGKASYVAAQGALAIAGEVVLRLPPPIWTSAAGTSAGFGALLSYDFTRHGAPVVFHANASFFLDNSAGFDDVSGDRSRKYALQITDFNQVRSGAALEGRFHVAHVAIRPFLEYAVDVPLGAPGTPPMRLVPGLRVAPWRGLTLDGLVEIGLTKPASPNVAAVPPWMLQLAVGWQLGVDQKGGTVEKVVIEKEKVVAEAPKTGTVSGVVVDAEKRAPIADAVVLVPGRNRLLTDPDGRFSVHDVAPGPFKVVVTKPGYEPREASGVVEAGKVLVLSAALSALPPEPPPPMTVRGTVLGEDDKAVVATVAVPSAGVAQKSSATGEFSLTVPSGEQSIEVSAPGYLAQGRRVTGRPGESLVVDFVLKPVPKQTLVVLKKEKIEIKKQVHFATNKDVILPDSAPLLDQIAATIISNPNLKLIRVEGHTDDQGDDAYNLELSQRRAASVVRALVERGVDAGRLKAVGYGETRPIESNKKPAGRAKNRRVEFMIEVQE